MTRLLCALAAAAAISTPVAAHVVVANPTAAPGAYHVAAFRIGHGCEGAPTTAIRIEIPPGITSVKNQPKAGWTFEATPGAVTWRGGPLLDSQFDEFAVQLHLPRTPGPLYFPTVQICGDKEKRWDQIPAAGQSWGSVPAPAPVLTITAPAAPPAPAVEHQH